MKNLNWTFHVSLGPHFAVAKWILMYVLQQCLPIMVYAKYTVGGVHPPSSASFFIKKKIKLYWCCWQRVIIGSIVGPVGPIEAQSGCILLWTKLSGWYIYMPSTAWVDVGWVGGSYLTAIASQGKHFFLYLKLTTKKKCKKCMNQKKWLANFFLQKSLRRSQ